MHCRARAHEQNMNKFTANADTAGPSSPNVAENNNIKKNKFHSELYYAMLFADISLNNRNNKVFSKFLLTYNRFSIPDQTT